jgi:hypothetical protein
MDRTAMVYRVEKAAKSLLIDLRFMSLNLLQGKLLSQFPAKALFFEQ